MNVVERLKQYIDYKGISKYRFYKDTGLSNGFLDKDSNIGVDKCEKILSVYTDIRANWLITGEGEMLKQPLQSHNRNIANAHGANNKIIQGGDVVIGRNVGDIGGIEDIRNNRHKKTSIENNEDYNRRISEIGDKYNTILLSKNELIQEKDERIKELKNQIEQLNKMIKLLCEK